MNERGRERDPGFELWVGDVFEERVVGAQQPHGQDGSLLRGRAGELLPFQREPRAHLHRAVGKPHRGHVAHQRALAGPARVVNSRPKRSKQRLVQALQFGFASSLREDLRVRVPRPGRARAVRRRRRRPNRRVLRRGPDAIPVRDTAGRRLRDWIVRDEKSAEEIVEPPDDAALPRPAAGTPRQVGVQGFASNSVVVGERR